MRQLRAFLSVLWHLWNVSAQKCVKGVYKIKIVQNKLRIARKREPRSERNSLERELRVESKGMFRKK